MPSGQDSISFESSRLPSSRSHTVANAIMTRMYSTSINIQKNTTISTQAKACCLQNTKIPKFKID